MDEVAQVCRGYNAGEQAELRERGLMATEDGTEALLSTVSAALSSSRNRKEHTAPATVAVTVAGTRNKCSIINTAVSECRSAEVLTL